MPELLTAKDVELKIFRKSSFGGYAIPDVEEFLNQIAEDLEAYVLRLNEQQRRILELEEALKKHEAMKDTIKDALILAQKSAKDKEDEARHQAELIVAKAESKMGEINVEARRRLDEAESAADDIVTAARTAAAQIIRSAEETREEAQKRFNGLDEEIARRMNEANERASEITTTARIEARRISGRVRHEIEESKRELNASRAERLRFLKESSELLATFEQIIEESRQKLERTVPNLENLENVRQEKTPLSFYPVSDNEEGEEVPASL
ncbi:MAG: DivIVA domain-containing protein [Synergistaceae bacterium]|jgi:DivIVA domain-containing protein|nr:DivIVA domain-containing protein [Synergistaceae bacterium]